MWLDTISQFRDVVSIMRQQGIVQSHMPVAVSFVSGFHQPSRFHWDGPETTNMVMINGPVYHNDNLSTSD